MTQRREAMRSDGEDGFEVVVWAVAPDATLRQAYADAGSTWLIEGPAPGPDWLGDAMEIATSGPPVPTR